MTHESCGSEMRDMGQWPDLERKVVVHRYQCSVCNEYVSIDCPELKLVEDGEMRFHTEPS